MLAVAKWSRERDRGELSRRVDIKRKGWYWKEESVRCSKARFYR